MSFVSRVFSHVERIDYEETFSLVYSIHLYPYDYFPYNIHGLESKLHECEEILSQWGD
jgi:hypothetical protein